MQRVYEELLSVCGRTGARLKFRTLTWGRMSTGSEFNFERHAGDWIASCLGYISAEVILLMFLEKMTQYRRLCVLVQSRIHAKMRAKLIIGCDCCT